MCPLLACVLLPFFSIKARLVCLLEREVVGVLAFVSQCPAESLAHCRDFEKVGCLEPIPKRGLSVLLCCTKLPHEKFKLDACPHGWWLCSASDKGANSLIATPGSPSTYLSLRCTEKVERWPHSLSHSQTFTKCLLSARHSASIMHTAMNENRSQPFPLPVPNPELKLLGETMLTE